ncbi:unnamed protein product, partial [Hymenolepis diminuta]
MNNNRLMWNIHMLKLFILSFSTNRLNDPSAFHLETPTSSSPHCNLSLKFPISPPPW